MQSVMKQKRTRNYTQRENTQLPYRTVHVGADSQENGKHINGFIYSGLVHNTRSLRLQENKKKHSVSQTSNTRYNYCSWLPQKLRSERKRQRASSK